MAQLTIYYCPHIDKAENRELSIIHATHVDYMCVDCVNDLAEEIETGASEFYLANVVQEPEDDDSEPEEIDDATAAHNEAIVYNVPEDDDSVVEPSSGA